MDTAQKASVQMTWFKVTTQSQSSSAQALKSAVLCKYAQCVPVLPGGSRAANRRCWHRFDPGCSTGCRRRQWWGAAASAFVLLYSTGDSARLGDTAKARLKAMVETNDGFEIAQLDLKICKPGEFLGARQSGALCSGLLTSLWMRRGWHGRGLAPVMLDKHAALAAGQVLRWLESKGDFLKA